MTIFEQPRPQSGESGPSRGAGTSHDFAMPVNNQEIVRQRHEELLHCRDALRERRAQLKKQGKERVLALREGRELDARNSSKLSADALKDCVALEKKLRKAADSLARALRQSGSRSSQ